MCLALIVLVVGAMPATTSARDFNDKLMNKPYADLRRWHLGFSIGLHVQDMRFTHNGYIAEDGATWFMEQPAYSPGFCVNGLLSLRLNDYFSLRFSPGMYFGNRNIKMVDTAHEGVTASQNIKSAYVVLPVDLKFASLRYRNSRPYLTGGVMPAFDISKKSSDYLKLKPMDVYLTVGLGCDLYLPYFKFIPEVKFCFGLGNVLEKNRPDLVEEPAKLNITKSLSKATSKMVVLTFYFE